MEGLWWSQIIKSIFSLVYASAARKSLIPQSKAIIKSILFSLDHSTLFNDIP